MCAATAYAPPEADDASRDDYSDDGDFESSNATEVDEPAANRTPSARDSLPSSYSSSSFTSSEYSAHDDAPPPIEPATNAQDKGRSSSESPSHVSYHSDEYEVGLHADGAPHDDDATTADAVVGAPSAASVHTTPTAAEPKGVVPSSHGQVAAAATRRRRQRGVHRALTSSMGDDEDDDAAHELEPAAVPTTDEELRAVQAENDGLYERLYALQRARCRPSAYAVGGGAAATHASTFSTTMNSRGLSRKEVTARLVQESLQLDRTVQLLRLEHRELRQRVAEQEQLIARFERASVYRELVETTKKEVAALTEEQRDLQLEMRYNGKLLLVHETMMESGEGEHRLHEELRAQSALARRAMEQALRTLEETERQRNHLSERVAALRQELRARQDAVVDAPWQELRELREDYHATHTTAQQLRQRLARVRSTRGRGQRPHAASAPSHFGKTREERHPPVYANEEAERDYLQERIVYLRAVLQHRHARHGPGQYTAGADRTSLAAGPPRVSFSTAPVVIPAESEVVAATPPASDAAHTTSPRSTPTLLQERPSLDTHTAVDVAPTTTTTTAWLDEGAAAGTGVAEESVATSHATPPATSDVAERHGSDASATSAKGAVAEDHDAPSWLDEGGADAAARSDTNSAASSAPAQKTGSLTAGHSATMDALVGDVPSDAMAAATPNKESAPESTQGLPASAAASQHSTHRDDDVSDSEGDDAEEEDEELVDDAPFTDDEEGSAPAQGAAEEEPDWLQF